MTTVSDAAGTTHTIESSEFKAKLLDLLKQAAETGAKIKVSENGDTLLNLAATKPDPVKSKHVKREPAFGKYKHLLISYGDITSPIDEDWEAKFNKKWDEKLGTA